jgi:hypothetical protein
MLLVSAEGASAADIQWNGGFNDSWHQEFNWDFFGSPFSIRRVPTNSDTATLATPANDVVRLYGDTAMINGLTVQNRIDLLTNGFRLLVDDGGAATTLLSGNALLRVDPASGGLGFHTDNLRINNAQLEVAGGGVQVDGLTDLVNDAVFAVTGATGSADFGGDVIVRDNARMTLVRTANRALTYSFAPDSSLTVQSSGEVEFVHPVGAGPAIEIGPGQHWKLEGSGTLRARGDLTVDGGAFTIESFGQFLLDEERTFSAINDARITFDAIELIAGNQTFSVASGADVTGTGGFHVGHLFSGGELTVDGPGTTVDLNTMLIGYPSPESSVISLVTLSNAASAKFGTLEIGNLTSPGSYTRARFDVETSASVEFDGVLRLGTAVGTSASFGDLFVTTGGTLTQTNSTGNSSVIGTSAAGRGRLFVSQGGQFVALDGDIVVAATGMIDVQGGTAAGVVSLNGDLMVAGQILIQATSGSASDPGGILRVAGPVVIDVGTIELRRGLLAADSIAFANGGALTLVSGTLSVDVFHSSLTLPDDCTLAPGESAGSTSILGSYTQQGGATLAVEIGGTGMGTQHDLVNVTGSAVIDGLLELSLIDDFAPAPDDTFIIFNAASLLGVFDNVANGQRLDATDGGGSFRVNYGLGSAFAPNQIVLSHFEPALLGDFDNDGDVDSDDLAVWTASYGVDDRADADNDGDSDGADFLAWQQHLGSGAPAIRVSAAVPEPATVVLLTLAAAGWRLRRRRAE